MKREIMCYQICFESYGKKKILTGLGIQNVMMFWF